MPLTASLLTLGLAPRALADAPDPRPVPTRKAHLRIESDAPLTLHRRVGRFGDELCQAPCDRVIRYDENDSFQIVGPFPNYEWFKLGERTQPLLMRVHAGSNAGTWVGLLATVVGGLMFFAPGILLIKGAAGASDEPIAAPDTQRRLGALMGGGSALLGLGIPFMVLSPTKVEIMPDPLRSGARASLTFHF